MKKIETCAIVSSSPTLLDNDKEESNEFFYLRLSEEPTGENYLPSVNDKVTITPHISAPTRLRSSIKSILKNIDRLKKGLQPLGLVEKERFY